MTRSTNRSINTLFLACAAFLAVGTIAPSLRFIRGAVAQERREAEADEARREMDELVSESAMHQARARAMEISVRLKMSPDEFLDFFRAEEQAGKRTESSDLAWARLVKGLHVPMRSDATEADFESAQIVGDTVAAFLRMKRSRAADDLRISPEELHSIQTEWTLRERRNYAGVLQRAADIVARGEAAKLQDAYEQALREFAAKAVNCRP
jgi:hypothetical protein